ncbi:uncharacterized protein LOC134250127 [Saccostrea cucullata]|uniref:uncharacterized protein LOC134250127 n=1 Tax=Saccostrea cuccullata TaxID=36930 RepID=UPI002ED328AB
MCLLLSNSYKINMKDENWMTKYNSVAKSFRLKEISKRFGHEDLEKYEPIMKLNESEISYSNELFKNISFLKFSKKSGFTEIFLTGAEKENVAEYCRSWNYRRREDEVCCWLLPDKNEAFLKCLGEDIFTHPTMEDQSFHEVVFKKVGIPMQIILRGDKSVKNFIENLKKGKTTMYHASGMIIGCAGSGKTTLLERLKGIDLEEIKKNISSTRGVDIHTDVFDVKDSIQANSSSQQQRFKLKLDKKDMPLSVPEPHSENAADDAKTQGKMEPVDDEGHAIKVSNSGQISQDDTDIKSTSSYPPQGAISASNLVEVTKENRDILGPNNPGISGNLQIDAKNISDKKITMTDFAGQCSYYASHQIFLSPRAFFILVLNMEKKFDDKVGEEVCCQGGSIYERWTHRDYIEFWMKSIHQYSNDKAPVLLIGTHSENKTEEEIMSFFHEIWATLEMQDKTLHRHLHEDRQFAVGFHDKESIENIKLSIVKVVQNLNHWGEKLPLSWVMFEKFFQEKKSQRIMNKEMLLAFNDALPTGIKLETVDDINFMLQFFHDIREILYYNQERLDVVIILDVQWFAKNYMRFASDWKKFDQTGELNDTLLTAIWEMKGIDFSEHKTNALLYMEKLGLLAKLDDNKCNMFANSLGNCDRER